MVATGSRSDYGLLRGVLENIERNIQLELQLLVTGMHLSPNFGSTINEIQQDDYENMYQVETLDETDSPSRIANSIGRGIQGSAEVISQAKPDILLVIGDRYETFAVVVAALSLRIPIAHIHGGETTVGVIDEAIRHSITKMSHLHFVANNTYRDRVIQLGEDPDRVKVVGGLGIDQISRVQFVTKQEIESRLGIRFRERNILVTFHPVTLEPNQSKNQFLELIGSLRNLVDTTIVITFPNADQESMELIGLARMFADEMENVFLFESLGQELYYSVLPHLDGLVGNSSSGLLEAPSFRIGTVNIGIRQSGRMKSDSVIDCDPISSSISRAIDLMFSRQFKESLAQVRNLYGDPGASKKIVQELLEVDIENILIKKFYDMRKS